MEMPTEVINAVKETQLELGLPKPRKVYVKESSKRIMHAIGNGLRTATSIANALGTSKAKIQSNLWHLKDKGYVFGEKKHGSNEFKYWLTTDKPTLDTLDLTPKKVAKKKKVPTKKVVPNPLGVTREQSEVSSKYSLAYIKELEKDVVFKTERISQLELSLVEKEKEVWTLECEVFDKKAIIAYLESKQFGGK